MDRIIVKHIDENGNLHKEDGPAVIWYYGCCLWYYHGKQMNCSSQEVFDKLIKLKAFW